MNAVIEMCLGVIFNISAFCDFLFLRSGIFVVHILESEIFIDCVTPFLLH